MNNIDLTEFIRNLFKHINKHITTQIKKYCNLTVIRQEK